MVSGITLEHCPPSAWNRVRHRVEYAVMALVDAAIAEFASPAEIQVWRDAWKIRR